MRLGFLPKEIAEKVKGRRVIWLHAVSVGEALASLSIIKSIKSEFPEHLLVVSTVTRTGFDLLSEKIKEDIVIYFPLDLTLAVKKTLNRVNPEIILIMETELWPNFIVHAWLKRIPIVILNGRISPRSYAAYSKIRVFTRFILNKIDSFCMQTEADAKRIVALGAPEEKVKIAGNLKFDVSFAHIISGEERLSLRQKLGIKPDERLWVAGSTHPKEEEMILEAYKILKNEFPGLRLLIAPRHIERSPDVEALIKSSGFLCARFSQGLRNPGNTVILLDQLGKLSPVYGAGEFVFVGGSLIPHGGQNMIEPASLAKPVIFGQYVFNFQEAARLLLEENGCLMVKDKLELLSACRALLGDEALMRRMGDNARKVVEQNLGATARNLGIIKEAMM
ncbi:MAG: 3-deoxy-D-manno-octulosonic acid transferase [Candidatus Omnitrophica bacterium]|nr:3-deoxy-D-manno-octulosonic acid transferase [Candidatus Omnitrophota bacterium]